ncbi:S8 family serine peptidase [Streptomyces sp. NPDC002573]|uniref:S8 family peptidase n=1 Tax=Streptomyces sp. NPDC002573 TaxID=3364651 RepID=UPI00367DCE1E
MPVMRHARRRLAGIGTAALLVGLVSAAPTHATPAAQGTVRYEGAVNTVPGSYIVLLKDGVRADSDDGRALARKYACTIGHTYVKAINGYAIHATASAARRFAADPAVASVVQSHVFRIASTQNNPPSWGLDRIDQKTLPLDGRYTYPDSAGQGVTAYIIDTGVRVTHNDFGGRASYGYDAVDNDNVAQDGNGHGTHVAGTVAGGAYGVAKKAKVVAVRVLDNSGSGTTDEVVAGLDWVAQHHSGPSVANMSLGGPADSVLDTAVRNTIASGVTFAVAAGNSDDDASGYSPARVAEAITVGAIQQGDGRASYSNYGSVLDLFAPGSSVRSLWNSSDTATNTLSGTSMATPHVTGAAALYLGGHPTATPAQVAAALTAAATTGVVAAPGTGSPNRLLDVGGGTGTPVPPPPTRPRFVNTTDYPIRDFSTVDSPITVTGVPGKAPANLAVEVHIQHTYIGDLQIQLVAPDGIAHLLKPVGAGGSTHDINTTYTVNAASRTANGTWRLRVGDFGMFDTGKIDSWALQF